MTNIVEAMLDPSLFGPTFRRGFLRGDSWKAWRVFLAALFGLGLDGDASVRIYQRHTGGRADVPTQQFREAHVIAGRRSGKSFIAALVAVYIACFRKYDDVLAPGEVGTVMVIGSDRKQCRVIMGYVDALLSIPILSQLVTNRLKESIELGRVRIEISTCDYRAVRGYTIIAAILDELAFWRDENSASPDTETLTALRPAMVTIPNALLLAISSPYAKRGALFEAYRDHYGKTSDVLIWKASSKEMNPTLSQAVIAAAYLRDAASARSEYGGEFRDDIESLFSAEIIEQRVVPGRLELPPISGTTYCAFCDPSGGVNDAMTLAVAHYEKDLAVLDMVREAVPPFSPEAVTKEFCDILKKYRLSEVTGDKYGAQWVAEAFEKLGVRYRASERNRSEIYLEFLPAVMSAQVELLDHRKLVNQLVNLERRTGRGRDIIDHGVGQHDDLSNCVAGVCVLALGAPGKQLGLVEFLKSGAAEKFLNETVSVLKPVSAPALPPPCPRCQGPRVLIGGVGLRCNGCGAVFANPTDKSPISTVPETGPCCSSPLLVRIPGGQRRCQQCGRQSGLLNQATNGVPRSQVESFNGRRAQFNPRGFYVALARLFGGPRK